MTLGPGEHCTTHELSDYLDGRLGPASEERLRAHLSACEVCDQSYASLAATVALLRQLPQVAPPRDFRIAPRAARPSRAARWYPWTRAASAVAAVLFLVLSAVDLGGLATRAPAPTLNVAVTAAATQESAAVAQKSVAPPAQVVASGAAATDACDQTTHVCAQAVGTPAPLPTPAPAPPTQPTVVARGSPAAAASSPWLRPWEALALALALACAAASWALARQAHPHPG